ncbi:hypothetical protein Tco_1034505 [Tanacetum coccineum]
MKHSYSNDDTCFSIDEILEEDFDALLDEGSKIIHSIKGTLLDIEIFAEFDEFMAITTDENSDSKSDIEDPPFEKITINTDYKIKTSLEESPTDLELKSLPGNLKYVFLEEPSFLPVIISSQLSKEKKNKLIYIKTSLEEPPTDLKLKPLPDNLEYVFLEEPSFLPVIISSQLSKEKKNKLIYVLKKHKQAFAWKMTDIPECVEVFMDDFSVFGNSFDTCLNNLDKMLQRCKDAHLVLNWEKCHFMVKVGIVLGHKVSSTGLEVDKTKTDVISKLPSLLISKVLKVFSDMPVFTDALLKTSKKLFDL